MNKIASKLYQRLILPIINSVAPTKQVSWGVALGTFIGFTPTMGAQMYLIAMLWGACRILRFHFYLPVGLAMVWISNPITVIPFYYVFLWAGNRFFQMMQWPFVELDWESFQQKFAEIAQENLWEMVQGGSKFLLMDLLLPMFVGCLFIAIPCAVVSYFVTNALLKRYRQSKGETTN